MRHDFRQFLGDVPRYGLLPALATLTWNIRFALGYRLGGFTSAKHNY
jgi:hypothetical protein